MDEPEDMTAGGLGLAVSDTGNLVLSLAALAGLMILQGVIMARDRSAPLNRRFLFGLRVLMMLFAGRALFVVTDLQVFRFFILLAAACVPVSVVILAEGMLRRHAPAWVKIWIAGGTTVFAVSALWWSSSIDPARLIGLLLFQISGFAIGGYLVLTRDRASLSAAENKAVERMALSLVVLMPLAAADFLMTYLGLPVQISPLGVLFLCWLAVSLARAQVQHRAPLLSFGASVAVAAIAGGVVARMAGLGRDGTILTLVLVLAAVLVAVLSVEAQSVRAEERSHSLLRHMAEDRSRDALGFLRGLQAHPMVEGAVIIEAPQLAEMDDGVLQHIFRVRPVLRRADPPFTDGPEGDHISHLFARYDASHILLVRQAPLALVALSMPAMSASPRAELELAAVQRMASLMKVGS